MSWGEQVVVRWSPRYLAAAVPEVHCQDPVPHTKYIYIIKFVHVENSTHPRVHMSTDTPHKRNVSNISLHSHIPINAHINTDKHMNTNTRTTINKLRHKHKYTHANKCTHIKCHSGASLFTLNQSHKFFI